MNANTTIYDKNNPIPLFYGCDEGYAGVLATSIASVMWSTKSFINFYILDTGLTEHSRKLIREMVGGLGNCAIEFIMVDAEKELAGFIPGERLPITTYNKFLIPKLKPELGKIIQLDVDVIALDDIKIMYDEDMHGHVIAAVPEDYREPLRQHHNGPHFVEKMNYSPMHRYFNGGNMLFDCAKWRQDNVFDGLCEVNKKWLDCLAFCDQDILNKYFESNYQTLDDKYNVMNQTLGYYRIFRKDDYADLMNSVVIRHFEGPRKPWNNECGCEGSKENWGDFWFFAEMTPFYDGLRMQFISEIANQQKWKKRKEQEVLRKQLLLAQKKPQLIPSVKYYAKLFGIIPLWQYRWKPGKKIWRLFGILPLMMVRYKKFGDNNGSDTKRLFGFLPIMIKRYKPNKVIYRLFGIIPLIKIKYKPGKKIWRLFGFIPLMLRRQKTRRFIWRLFGFVPLIRIKY